MNGILTAVVVPIALALGLYPAGGVAAQAVIRPAASEVNTDPQRDVRNPSRNEAVWIPSGGVLMNGVMYVASGVRPHPVVLLLHGLPGNEENLDLAQSLRRSGFDVLTFHYRGSWGSPGQFTLGGGIEDGEAAYAFLQQPTTVAKYHIDLARAVVIGHSYGGFVAARVAAAHPTIRGMALIAPWSPAADTRQFQVPEAQFAVAAHAAFDDVDGRLGGYSAVDIAKDILQPGKDWRLESTAPAFRNLPMLVLVAKHDSPDDQASALIAALRKAGAPSLMVAVMNTDHAFSDYRIAMQQVVLDWIRDREI
jgi:uncharacterized protein